MVVISEFQEREGSVETSTVNIVKGKILGNSSEDDVDMTGERKVNLMGKEGHAAFEGESDDGDDDDDSDVDDDSDEDDESEEMIDDNEINDSDDNVAEEEMSNESDDDEDDESVINDDIEDSDEEESIPPEETLEKSETDIVKSVLAKAAREAEKNESIAVSKHLDLEYDLGTLLAIDNNELDLNSLRNSTDNYLMNLARDNAQLLINNIWELPITRKESEIVAILPKPTYKLPREKPVPKPKPMTKWERFSQEKGLVKNKKTNKLWDDVLQKWIPRYGYLKKKAEKEKQWLIEAKKNDDPMADPYAKLKASKQERVAKNELQRLRNLAKANNIKVPRGDKMKLETSIPKRGKKKAPRVGFFTSDKMNNAELKEAMTISRKSTASVGKFQKMFSKEKDAKNIGSLMPIAKRPKRVFANAEEEQKSNLQIVETILNKRPKLDLEKAVNRQINSEQRQRAQEKSQTPKGKGRGKARGGGGKTKGGGKVRGGGGKKNNLKGRGQGKVTKGSKPGKGKPNRKGGKKP